MRSTRLIRAGFTIAALVLLVTCTASEDCAAGNPLMPVCFDPTPAQPQVVLMRAWDSTWTRADLYTMNSDGTNAVRLTTDGMRNLRGTPTSPVWSPDGRWIAFARRPDGSNIRSQIYVVAADGSNLRNISNQTTAFDWSPTWSPDGRRIAFQSDRHNPATATCCVTSLYVMNADGSDLTRLTTDWNDKLPRWSPDGTTIAFMSSRNGGINHIFAMNADGSNVRQLTTVGTDRKPVWSPDGTRIAFEATRDSAMMGTMSPMGTGISVMNADGSGQMTVGQGLTTFMIPTWSSDGRQIFFCGAQTATSKMHLYAVAMSGGAIRLVTDENSDDCSPDFKRPRIAGSAPMSP
jgi:Tol biopolymer transport system component